MFRAAAISLRVGESNPRLDALLEKEGLETAACVHAGRESVRRDLAEALEEQGYVGTGVGSVLVVGMPRAVAKALGQRLRQRAVIFHERGRRTELVFVG